MLVLEKRLKFAFLSVGDPYTSADECKSDQVLYLPYIFVQNQCAEDTGKYGLGKLDNKQF